MKKTVTVALLALVLAGCAPFPGPKITPAPTGVPIPTVTAKAS